MVKVKICGLTRLEDALAAVRAGADALGFVFAESPRRVTPDQVRALVRRLPPLVTTVGVFADAPAALVKEIRSFCALDLVQLHGREREESLACLGRGVIKALRVDPGSEPDPEAFPGATLLLDFSPGPGRGGNGRAPDWRPAAAAARQREIILAGGLCPDNVAQAIDTVQPYAVDVSSGVEIEPGRKDHDKLRSFIRQAKTAGRLAG